MELPNLEYIEALSGGDSSFKATLIKVVKEEFPSEAAQYNQHIKLEKYLKAADDVHKLKHKISILGLVKSYEIAICHEEDLRRGEMSLEAQFQDIITSISQYLTNL